MFDVLQEIIDHKILTCNRIINCEKECYVTIYIAMISFCVAILNTVDYIDPTGRCVFRTTASEKHKVVFQMVRRYIS